VNETDERTSIGRVVADLEIRFPLVPKPVIVGIVDEKYRAFDGAPVRDYIPVMVRRSARESLFELVSASRARWGSAHFRD
jgi:hypothetical protein